MKREQHITNHIASLKQSRAHLRQLAEAHRRQNAETGSDRCEVCAGYFRQIMLAGDAIEIEMEKRQLIIERQRAAGIVPPAPKPEPTKEEQRLALEVAKAGKQLAADFESLRANLDLMVRATGHEGVLLAAEDSTGAALRLLGSIREAVRLSKAVR